MNFIWTDFGVLDRCSYDTYGNLFVHNTENESRKMSAKYSSIFNQIEHKCRLLQGKFVQIRTSQTTNNWSALIWFSDISLSGTQVNWTAPSNTYIENPDELKEKVEKLTQERDQANIRTNEAIVREQEAVDIANQAVGREQEAIVTANAALESEYEAYRRAEESDKRAEESDKRAEASDKRADAFDKRAEESDKRADAFEIEKDGILLTLEMLMAQGESKFLEYKTSFSLDVDKIQYKKDYNPIKEVELETESLKNIVAFLNSEGGRLLIGISESNPDGISAVGIENEVKKFHKNDDKFLNYVTRRITERISQSVFSNVTLTFVKHGNGTTILKVEVIKSSKPVFLKPGDEFYIRLPASAEILSGDEMEKYKNAHFKDTA